MAAHLNKAERDPVAMPEVSELEEAIAARGLPLPLGEDGQVPIIDNGELVWAEVRLLPPGIQGSVNRFNPENCVYNLKAANTERMRSKVGQARAGIDHLHLRCLGDSLTNGFGGSTPTGGTAGHRPNLSSFPAYLRSALIAAGIENTGTGVVFPWCNDTGYADSMWVLDAAWGQPSESVMRNYVECTTNNKTATFTSDVAGTVVELWTFGDGFPIAWSIDGGAVTGTTTPDTTNTVQKIVLATGLANTTHTVALTSTGTSARYIVGVNVRQAVGAAHTGFFLTNAGINGSATANWGVETFRGPRPVQDAVGSAGLEIVGIGMNDAMVALDPASFELNLSNFVSNRKFYCDVILWIPAQPEADVSYGAGTTPSEAEWLAYRQAWYDVADAQDVPLVDFTERWSGFDAAEAAGLMYDPVHPRSQGYADIAQAMASLILS